MQSFLKIEDCSLEQPSFVSLSSVTTIVSESSGNFHKDKDVSAHKLMNTFDVVNSAHTGRRWHAV